MRFLKTGLAAGFFAALLALSGCKEAPEPAAPAQGAVETVVPAALQSNVSGAYTTSGTAAARERVAIASRVTAYLRALPAREGARVSKGDSVARLDVTDVRAGIEAAEASLAAARAAERDAAVDMRKFRSLHEAGVVSDNEWRKVRLNHEAAASRLRAAEAQLDAARVQLEYADVRAPFDGTVVMLVKREGDLVTPGAPIVMMESAGAPVFETYVPESFAPGVREGMAVRIELKGRAPLAGAVERVVHSADQLTRTCLVKIAFSGDAADVMPGTFGTAVFELAGTSEVRVAASALTKRAGLEGVFVVRDGEAKFRWLRLGERRGDFVTVLAGLEGGEVVVDSPRATLNEGSPVRIADRQN